MMNHSKSRLHLQTSTELAMGLQTVRFARTHSITTITEMLSRLAFMNKEILPRLLFCTALSIFAAGSSAQAQTSFKFSFGTGKAEPGWTQVSPTNFYSATAGFGFEPGAQAIAGKDFTSSTAPFYFSVKEPE